MQPSFVNTNFPRNFRNDFKTGGEEENLTLTILERVPKLEENRFDFSIPFRLVFSCPLTELAELNEIWIWVNELLIYTYTLSEHNYDNYRRNRMEIKLFSESNILYMINVKKSMAGNLKLILNPQKNRDPF